MLFLVISHLKVVQYYHLVSFKFSAARVWQGADCGGAFSRPGIRQDGKILRTCHPICHTFCRRIFKSLHHKHYKAQVIAKSVNILGGYYII